MTTGSKNKEEEFVERHILVAVDGSENARRAVQFVGDFFGCYPGFRVTLFHGILEPGSGYFENDKKKKEWLDQRRAEAEALLDKYSRLLIDSGFVPEKIERRIEAGRENSVADLIIKEQENCSCCTIVMGRRGISKKEEIIYGSTSNKILHSASHCAVMVVE